MTAFESSSHLMYTITSTKSREHSTSGLLSMLREPSQSLRKAALNKLLCTVNTQWHEVAHALPELEALSEDVENQELDTRELAARVASRVFFHLDEPNQALRLALESGEAVFHCDRVYGTDQKYVECLTGAAIDAYILRRRQVYEAQTQTQTNGLDSYHPGVSNNDGDVSSLPIEKLQAVVYSLLQNCCKKRNYQHALGVVLEAHEVEKVAELLFHCANTCEPSKVLSVIDFGFQSAMNLVTHKFFRLEIVRIIATRLSTLVNAHDTPAQIKKAGSFSLANAHQVLGNLELVANIISSFLDKTGDDSILGLQLCFDLVESGDQSFVNGIAVSLSTIEMNRELEQGNENNIQTIKPRTSEVKSLYEKANKILIGGFSSELAISFLHKFSQSDPLIIENLKSTLDQRSSGRNSVLHNCAVLAHSYLNAGTTNDAFLRNNLDWMRKASNWSKFSATASLGVVHIGHITEAMTLLEPYLPPNPSSDVIDSMSSKGGYAEGGSLYALGLIHGSHPGSSASKRIEANKFLISHLKANHLNEPVSHGAALGVGLTAFGTNNLELVNELKELLYTDSAVCGEAAGISIGLVLAGSGAGNIHHNLDHTNADEANDVISELKNYARETQHEKIIRGIVLGIALMNYGQEENADFLVDEMRADRDPLLRYGAQYALALAYCGTGSNKAIRLLLHTAVSDVSDDVRMAAVLGLAFVLFKTPHRVPELVSLLLESFNPHVRYASCMAVGIAMAGSGNADAISQLEPMLTDMTDFVRQGAIIGTSLIYMQQSDTCNGRKIKLFREKLSSLTNDKHQTTLTKMGAIIATGIIDAGGRNCSFELASGNDFTKMKCSIGAALWLQHWYWFPMMHMFSLAITPSYTIGLNKDFKFPKGFQILCNSRPTTFAYPKRLEGKKEEKKKRVETVTLSTTAKSKARLARKKAREGDQDFEIESSVKEVSEEEMSFDELEESGTDTSKKKTSENEDRKTSKKKSWLESTVHVLPNPCRITKLQSKFCSFDLQQRYCPIRINENPRGVILLTDGSPGEEEDLGMVKAPSIETDDEAGPPAQFEWDPLNNPDDSAVWNNKTNEAVSE